MHIQPQTLWRIHRTFFPESPVPVEWCERLAVLLQNHEVDSVTVIAYMQAMCLHERGLLSGNPGVADAVNCMLPKLKNFGSKITPVIYATNSGTWLAHVIKFYEDVGIEVVYALNELTSGETRRVICEAKASSIELGGKQPVDWQIATIPKRIGAQWVLSLDEDELPTPGLLKFVDEAVECSPKIVWGFSRVHCRYDAWSDQLEYSQFLPFGPLATVNLQWRLFSRSADPKEKRAARGNALLLNFDWVVRTFSERIDRLGRENGKETVPSPLDAATLNLQEAVPESWHMFAKLEKEPYKEFARKLHHATALKNQRPFGDNAGSLNDFGSPAMKDLSSVDPVALRDEIVAQAADCFSRGDIVSGAGALRNLRWATIDDQTLSMTDPYQLQIAGGKRIVATCDPKRRPSSDEILIVYGNYPHIFENIVVNNPIKRHVASFGDLKYDKVEYDHRWDEVGQIYLINADDRPDRYDAVLRELASARAPFHRITRIPAIKDNSTGVPPLDGQLGCMRSHIDALRRAKREGHAHALVIEDDFCFTSEIDAHLNDLQAFFKGGYEYFVCLLATSKYGRIIPKDELVSISAQPCTNTGAYLVSAEGIEKVLPLQEFALTKLKETGNIERYAVDIYWTGLQSSGKFLVFRRKLGFQSSSFSDIERRISRYLD